MTSVVESTSRRPAGGKRSGGVKLEADRGPAGRQKTKCLLAPYQGTGQTGGKGTWVTAGNGLGSLIIRQVEILRGHVLFSASSDTSALVS